MKDQPKLLLGMFLMLSGDLIAEDAGKDPFADDKGRESAGAKPRATEANASFKQYRNAVMKVKSMHEKNPFPSMEVVVEAFLKIVGRKWDDLKPSSGGSKWEEWDTIYQIKIGDEFFSLQMSGPMEQEKDGLRRSIQKCDLIEFNVGQLDSSFAYETLWTWHAKPVPGSDRRWGKEAPR